MARRTIPPVLGAGAPSPSIATLLPMLPPFGSWRSFRLKADLNLRDDSESPEEMPTVPGAVAMCEEDVVPDVK